MDAIKAKLAVWSKDKRIIKPAIIIASALLILIIFLCISNVMRTNIQKKYSATVDEMQEQVYQNLATMTELFARVDDPTVDVRNKLIPELKAQYTAASSMNSVLMESGEHNAVLSADQIAAFDAAFEQYAAAYRQGSATGLAKADMAACIESAQALVDAHNAPSEPLDEVVIINASSGKIENTTTVQ